MRNKLLFALKCSLPLFIGGMVLNSCKDDSPVSGFKEEEGEYVYDYDRYEDGMSAEEFLANYQGIPFKKDQEGNSLLIISGEPATVEAEDFDDGGEGVSFHFQNAGYGGYDIVKKKELLSVKAVMSLISAT